MACSVNERQLFIYHHVYFFFCDFSLKYVEFCLAKTSSLSVKVKIGQFCTVVLWILKICKSRIIIISLNDICCHTHNTLRGDNILYIVVTIICKSNKTKYFITPSNTRINCFTIQTMVRKVSRRNNPKAESINKWRVYQKKRHRVGS